MMICLPCRIQVFSTRSAAFVTCLSWIGTPDTVMLGADGIGAMIFNVKFGVANGASTDMPCSVGVKQLIP